MQDVNTQAYFESDLYSGVLTKEKICASILENYISNYALSPLGPVIVSTKAQILYEVISKFIKKINIYYERPDNSNAKFFFTGDSVALNKIVFKQDEAEIEEKQSSVLLKAEVQGNSCKISALFISETVSYSKYSFDQIETTTWTLSFYISKGLDHNSLSHFQNCKIPPPITAISIGGITNGNGLTGLTWCHVNLSLGNKEITKGGIDTWKITKKKSKGYLKSARKDYRWHHQMFAEELLWHLRNSMTILFLTQRSLTKQSQYSLMHLDTSLRTSMRTPLDSSHYYSRSWNVNVKNVNNLD